jgi:hypothetical protein
MFLVTHIFDTMNISRKFQLKLYTHLRYLDHMNQIYYQFNTFFSTVQTKYFSLFRINTDILVRKMKKIL